MTPKRAYAYCMKIAAETFDDIYALGDDARPEEAVEIILAAAKRLGLTDADTPALIEAWPKVTQRLDEIYGRVSAEEGDRHRMRARHLVRRVL